MRQTSQIKLFKIHGLKTSINAYMNANKRPPCSVSWPLIRRRRLRRMLDYSNRYLRGILLRMMHRVVRDHALFFVVIVAAGVEVAVETRKIAAGNFDAKLMSSLEVVAGIQRLQRDFVGFARFHPNGR